MGYGDPIVCKYECKVVYDKPENGRQGHKDTANKYLTVGETYTMYKKVIHSCHTEIFIKEYPEIAFNSVMFSDPSKQSISVMELTDEELQAIREAMPPKGMIK